MLGTRRSTPGAARRRHAALCAVVAVLALVMSQLLATSAGAVPAAGTTTSARANDPGAIEAEFVRLINDLRAARGLGTLSIDAELTAASRSWAGSMERAGGISHAKDLSVGVSADWGKLGENVGEGNEVGPLFDAFVASPSHLKNLVDPAFTRVGVGVVVAPSGRIFTTHRFMGLRPAPAPAPPPPPQPEPQPSPPPAPPSSVPPTTAAPTTTTAAPVPVTAATRPVGRLGPLHRLAALVAT